jgi:hypothetical protein
MKEHLHESFLKPFPSSAFHSVSKDSPLVGLHLRVSLSEESLGLPKRRKVKS